MQTITSPHNQRIKDVARLRRRRGRDKQGRLVIDGVRELSRALDGGLRIVEAFFCPQLADEETLALVGRLETLGTEVAGVTPPLLEKIAFGERASRLVAVAEMPATGLDRLQLPPAAVLGVLEGVEKPGNVGAVARTADAAGLGGLLLADPETDVFNPNAIRASLGTVFTLSIAVAGTPAALDWLRQGGYRIVAARVDASVPYDQFDFRGGRLAIVLGSEARGLSAHWSGPGIDAVRLPMRGAADSLNVSTTAAVLFYEAQRQRG